MPTYRPRMAASLVVPVMGTRAERIEQAASSEAIQLLVNPKRIRISRNDHNHADECEVTLDWTELGVDPRMLDHGVLAAYIENADDSGIWNAGRHNCRFIGIIEHIDRSGDLDSPMQVSLKALDYTKLFLSAKPFGSSGIPDYSQTLQDAWRRVCEQTPGAEILADRLVLDIGIGETTVTTLGAAVAERFRKLGKVPTHPDTDAWAVWQQCVGMLGLISYIDLDECYVTTATNLYTEGDAPRLVWGRNITSLKESRASQVAGKGIGLTSFDPLTGTTLEAYYPPIGDPRINRKRAKATKVNEAALRKAEDREYLSFPGVSQQDVLEKIAQRVWEERSRQELEGSARTVEMWTERVNSKKQFDLLDLRAGDSVRIEFDPQDKQILTRLPTRGAQLRFLTQRGYSDDTAKLIVANIDEFARLEPTFLTKDVSIELEVDGDGGSFGIEINFINRIQVSGDTE